MDPITTVAPIVGNIDVTPSGNNYIDVYDLYTKGIPTMRAEAIQKYNPTITGMLDLFAGSVELTADQYRWSEEERMRTYYSDCIVTTTGTGASAAFVLTRAGGGVMALQQHERLELHLGGASSGVFAVAEINSAKTSATILSVDKTTTLAESALFTAAGSPHASVTLLSHGIHTGKGVEGSVFKGGKKIPYSVYGVTPEITWDFYSENGSEIKNIAWILVNGQPRWFIPEIDRTRMNLWEKVEIKNLEGTKAVAGSGVAVMRGTDDTFSAGSEGVFSQVRSRGATTAGLLDGLTAIEALTKHYDKYEGAGANLFLCSREQELKLDEFARSFNSGGADLDFIGDYSNSEKKKILDLGYSGFKHGGHLFKYQVWRYLTDATFRGATGLDPARKINYFGIPIGMTPVGDGDHANLDMPARKNLRHYMTKVVKRDYETRLSGGTWNAHTNHDDKFSISFKHESCIAVSAAEKFVLSEGAGS